jgi:hypothetical protein
MKYTLAIAVCAAFAIAAPVLDTFAKAPRDMHSKSRRQLDALTGLLGGGGAAADPLAGLLGGKATISQLKSPDPILTVTTGAGDAGGGDLLDGLAAGGLPIPKRQATKTRRRPEPQLDALTGLLGGASGAQASNGADPLAGLLGGLTGTGGAAGGLGDLLPIKKE